MTKDDMKFSQRFCLSQFFLSPISALLEFLIASLFLIANGDFGDGNANLD